MTEPPATTIRFATLTDLLVLREMWLAMQRESHASYPGDLTGLDAVDEFTRQAARVLADPDTQQTYCLLATDAAGAPIGFHCFGYQHRDLGTPHVIAFCYWIYVIPPYRTQTVAEDLIQFAVLHALGRGVETAEISRHPGQAGRRGLGFSPYAIHSHAPLNLILERLQARRRHRAERAALPAKAAAAAEEGSHP